MYMILYWVKGSDYITCIQNEDGSIKLFEKLEEADKWANEQKCNAYLRVISIEGIGE